MVKFPLAKDSFDQEEIEAGIQVLKSGRYTMGEKVREFESELAKWVGVKHAIMVNSGSSANLAVIEALLRRAKAKNLLQAGDEVLVPALSWPTTVWPVLQLGLVPVYVDIDPKTLAISLESAEKSLSKKTKAMFLIHVLGLCADMKAIQSFCQKHQIILIEDCCESFGAFYENAHVGSFGFAGTLSHFFSHHLTTMEGGMILTQDAELADDLKSIRAHGWVRDRSDKDYWSKKSPEIDDRFLFITTGYNIRPLEVEAAIGLVQLKKIEGFLEKRENVARLADEWTKKHCPWMHLVGAEYIKPTKNYRERRHSWMNLPFVISADSKISCQDVKNHLESCGVETRPVIAGNLARHPVSERIQCRKAESLKNSDQLLKNGFMIGCHPGLSDQEIGTLEKALASLGQKFS